MKLPLQQHMVDVSHAAFPLYVTVVCLTELFRKKGWSNTCDSLEVSANALTSSYASQAASSSHTLPRENS